LGSLTKIGRWRRFLEHNRIFPGPTGTFLAGFGANHSRRKKEFYFQTRAGGRITWPAPWKNNGTSFAKQMVALVFSGARGPDPVPLPPAI
jgi:hypothetical protein